MEISNRCKEIILGSLLGDGSLVRGKRYVLPRFEMRHSIIQEEYFFWKVKELKEISGRSAFRIQPPDGWSKKEKLHYHSRSLPALEKLYRLTRRNGKFCFKKDWLKLLTPISLLVWWLDDGSLIKNSRQGVFCTEGFKHHQLPLLSQHLKKRWNIRTAIGRRGKYHQLKIYSTEELKKFLRLILPHFSVKTMLPKVILLYKDSYLQQRWISEVHQLTGFPKSVIERALAEKKARWKKFRE